MHRIAPTAIVLAFLAYPALAADPGPFRAQGNEPSWSVSIDHAQIVFQPLNGEAVTIAPVPAPRRDGDMEVYEASTAGRNFALTISPAVCADTMSGMPFPKSVAVSLDGRVFSGCGGEPASLLQGGWRIAAIDGAPVLGGSSPTLSFAASGEIAGNGSCNRFFGGFALTGEGLTASDIGSSMMMCEEALMEQEANVLAILKGLAGFAAAPEGGLVLRAGDGRTLTLARDS